MLQAKHGGGDGISGQVSDPAVGRFCIVTALVAPAALLVVLTVFFPGHFARACAFITNVQLPEYLDSSDLLSRWNGYFFRLSVDILSDIYNASSAAFMVAAGAAVISWSLRYLPLRAGYILSPVSEGVLAMVLFGALTFLSGTPFPLLLCFGLLLAYLSSFLFGEKLLKVFGDGGWRCLMLPLSLFCLPHLFMPAPFFKSGLDCSRKYRGVGEGLPVFLSRVWVCLITFPLLSLATYSSRVTPISPSARPILKMPGLYDVVLDEKGGRLLVTFRDGNNGWIFNLDTLAQTGRFTVPTLELESMVLDPLRREFYHVDRLTGNILALDADTFRVKRVGNTPVRSSGSTKLALDRTSGKMLVSWENDNLFMVDRDSLVCEFLGRPGNVNPLADESTGMVYFNSEKGRFIQALDLKHKVRGARVKAPYQGERMALAEKRSELFVPDPVFGKVWVYSAPWLGLSRKLPAELGVRPLAVDDEHGLLLMASVVTGYLSVVDIADGRPAGRYYIGKYPRTIRLDTSRRRAFVTLAGDGLYELDY